MTRFSGGLVLAAVFQVIFCQDQPEFASGLAPPNLQQFTHPFEGRIPRHCWAPPPGIDIHKCCPIPKLYPDEVMESCGVKKPTEDSVPPPRSRVPCKEGICLMKTANLLREDESVDYEKLRTFIDIWGESNSDFTEAIDAAKNVCAKDGGPAGPPVCEQDRIFFCMTSNILWNCKLRDLEGCDILKQHMDECRPYYTKLREGENGQGA